MDALAFGSRGEPTAVGKIDARARERPAMRHVCPGFRCAQCRQNTVRAVRHNVDLLTKENDGVNRLFSPAAGTPAPWGWVREPYCRSRLLASNRLPVRDCATVRPHLGWREIFDQPERGGRAARAGSTGYRERQFSVASVVAPASTVGGRRDVERLLPLASGKEIEPPVVGLPTADWRLSLGDRLRTAAADQHKYRQESESHAAELGAVAIRMQAGQGFRCRSNA